MSSSLPIDIWHIIFQFLTPPDLLSLSLTNQTFNSAILPSSTFRSWRNLCPTSRKPLAMTWSHALSLSHARSTGLTGSEPIYRSPDAVDSEEEQFNPENPFPIPRVSFPEVITEVPGRELVDLAGLMSARDGTMQYIAEMDMRLGIVLFPRVVTSWRVNIRDPTDIEKGVRTTLPHEKHLVRPSGEQLVGGTLLWVDDVQAPLHYTISEEAGVQFRVSPEGGHLPSPFEFSYLTVGDEPVHSQYSDTIVNWLAMMSPSNQMFSGVPALKNRRQRLQVYDVFDRTLKVVDVKTLLGPGVWSAPWILPMGSDNHGNLIVKIVDSDHTRSDRRIRMIQRNFDMDKGQVRWSIDMVDAVASTPWDSHLYNDHCCGYIYSRGERLYANIYDLEHGNQISTIGPFPVPMSPGIRRWQCILTSFFLVFQDRRKSFETGTTTEANPTPCYLYRITTGEFLYRIDPPTSSVSFEPPRSWIHRGEDASERYILFNGLGQRDDPTGEQWPERLDGSKKWLILDTVRKEWLYATSILDRWRFTSQGVHVLFRESGGDDSVQSLRFQYARINIPVQ